MHNVFLKYCWWQLNVETNLTTFLHDMEISVFLWLWLYVYVCVCVHEAGRITGNGNRIYKM